MLPCVCQIVPIQLENQYVSIKYLTFSLLSCFYQKDAFTLTPYCYTQIQTKNRGKYCIPTEPRNKAAVEAELEKLDNFIKRIAGDLGQVIKLKRKNLNFII